MPCNVMDANSDMYGAERSTFVDSSYQVNDDDSIPVYANVQLYPCSNCGRSFNADTLVKFSDECKSAKSMIHFVFFLVTTAKTPADLQEGCSETAEKSVRHRQTTRRRFRCALCRNQRDHTGLMSTIALRSIVSAASPFSLDVL